MYTPLLNHSSTSYLLTSSDARHAIIMNATISESNRNLTDMIGLVTNGTMCDQSLFLEVNTTVSHGGSIHNQLNWKIGTLFLQFYLFVILFRHTFTDVFHFVCVSQYYMNETIFFPDENRPGEMASLSCQFDQFITSKYVHLVYSILYIREFLIWYLFIL